MSILNIILTMSVVDLIFTVAEIVGIGSYFFKDMLFLRTATLMSLLIYLFGYYLQGFDTEGTKSLLAFTFSGIVITVYQLIRLFIDRVPVLLPEALKDIYVKHFHMMTAQEFHKIYKLAHLKQYPKGELIAVQDQPIAELLMVKTGMVDIIRNDVRVTTLTPGFFIGEMSFLTGGLATASVKVSSDMMDCVAWNKEDLIKIESSNYELYIKMKEAIGLNLIDKLSAA